LKTDVKKLEDNKIMLTVEVPAVDVDRMLNQAAKVVSQKLSIPGFRKGSAPRSVVEAKAGKEAIVDEFLNGDGLTTVYSWAIGQTEYDPIAAPQVDIKQGPEAGKPFIFEATVEVKPEIDLTGYNKIKVNQDKVDVTDEEVDREVEALRDRFSEIKDTLKDKAEKGLFALIDFEGTVEGKPLEGGVATDYLLEIGSGAFWPGFEDKVVGMKAGEERVIEIDIPEQYFEKSLAGKPATFKVKVKELKTKVLPPLDAEFAKKVGFESVDGFKKDVRENILRVKESQAEDIFGSKVVEAVANTVKVAAPQTMVDDYTDRMLSNFVRQLQQIGATLNDYLESQETPVEDFRKNIAADAAKAAKSDLVLEAIAKQEEIAVSDEELESSVATYIEKMGEEGSYFTSGPDAAANRIRLRSAIKVDLIRAKTIDFLISVIGVKSKDASDKKTEKPKAEKKSAGKKEESK
jgi:trigger factor